MSECFNTEELLANVRKLANENDDLRDQIGEWRAKAEEKDQLMERMRAENSALLRELEEVQKRLNVETRARENLRHRLNEKENLSVRDLMVTLSGNGAQSVLISFK